MARQRRSLEEQMVDLVTQARVGRGSILSTPAMAPVGKDMIEDNAILSEHLSNGAVTLETLAPETHAIFDELSDNLSDNRAAQEELQQEVTDLKDVRLPQMREDLKEAQGLVDQVKARIDPIDAGMAILEQTKVEHSAAIKALKDVTLPALAADLEAAEGRLETNAGRLSSLFEEVAAIPEQVQTAKQEAISAAQADALAKANAAQAAAVKAADLAAKATAKAEAEAAESRAAATASADAKAKADAAQAAALASAKTYADAQASGASGTALEAAKADATAKANAAKQAAIDAAALDATAKKEAAEATAAADAKVKADKALADAKIDATTKADAALASAKSDAQTKADAAKAAAITAADTAAKATAKAAAEAAEARVAITAAADAKSKADAAQAAALAAAKTYAEAQASGAGGLALEAAKADATSKADAAKAAAITAAAADATAKKEQAEANAAADAKKKADQALVDAKADATTKADKALADAKLDAKSQAAAAQAAAITAADTAAKATAKLAAEAAEARVAIAAAADAKSKADAAEAAALAAAKTYAESQATGASAAVLEAAKTDAQNKANAAKQAAIDAASLDATAKSELAESNAALDAKNKADKALVDAKADAAIKANAALDAALASAPRGQNVVMNGGFEQDLTGWDPEVTPDSKTHGIDTTVSRTGGRSFYTTGRGGFRQQGIPVTAGQTWEMGLWYKTEANYSNSNAGGIRIQAHINGTWADAASSTLRVNTEWTRSSQRYKVPAGVTQIRARFAFNYSGGAKAWLDDVELVDLTAELAAAADATSKANAALEAAQGANAETNRQLALLAANAGNMAPYGDLESLSGQYFPLNAAQSRSGERAFSYRIGQYDVSVNLPDIAVTPGNWYQASFWMKADRNITVQAGMPMLWVKNDGTAVNQNRGSGYLLADRNGPLTMEYRQITFAVQAEPGMKAMRPRFFVQGSNAVAADAGATVYMDDFILKDITEYKLALSATDQARLEAIAAADRATGEARAAAGLANSMGRTWFQADAPPIGYVHNWDGPVGNAQSTFSRDGVEVRRNLCTNPRFQNNANGWAGSTSAWKLGVARKTNLTAKQKEALRSDTALELAWEQGGLNGSYHQRTYPEPLTEPRSVHYELRAIGVEGDNPLRVFVELYNASGGRITGGAAGGLEPPLVILTPGMTHHYMVDGTLPVGTSRMVFTFYRQNGSGLPPGKVLFSSVLVEEFTKGDFFDGNTPDEREMDLWIDTDDGNTPKRWNGSGWAAVTDQAAITAATAAASADATAKADKALNDSKAFATDAVAAAQVIALKAASDASKEAQEAADALAAAERARAAAEAAQAAAIAAARTYAEEQASGASGSALDAAKKHADDAAAAAQSAAVTAAELDARSKVELAESRAADDAAAKADKALADAKSDATKKADAAEKAAKDAAQANIDLAVLKGQSLILNGDFEAGATGWELVTGATVIAAAGRNSAMGLRVTPSAGNVWPLNQWNFTSAGRVYQAEMWVRRTAGTTEATRAAGFTFQHRAGGNGTVTATTVYGLTEAGTEAKATDIPTNAFVKLIARITIPDGSSTQVRCAPWFLKSVNTYDVDNVVVVDVTEAVAAQAAAVATAEETTITKMNQVANSKNATFYGTAAPTATNPKGSLAGDTYRRRNSAGNIIGEWEWSGSAWTQRKMTSESMTAVDVGVLTAGTAIINEAVAKNIVAGTASFQTVDIGNITVTGDAKFKGIVAEKMAAQAAEFISLDIGTGTFGEMDGGRIKANTVSTKSLLVGSFDNLLENPSFEYGAKGWEGVSGVWSVQETGGVSTPGLLRCKGITARTFGPQSNLIPLETGGPKDVAKNNSGAKFRLSGWVKTNATSGTPTGELCLYSYDAAGKFITGANRNFNLTGLATNTWQYFSTVMEAPNANAVFIKLRVNATLSHVDQEMLFDDLAVVRAMDGSVIVNGSVNADAIDAKSVGAAVGTFVELNVENLRATKTAKLNDVVAETIGAGVGKFVELSTDQLKAGTAQMDTLTSNKLFGDIVAGRKFYAEQIVVATAGNIMPDVGFNDAEMLKRRNTNSTCAVALSSANDLALTNNGTALLYCRPFGTPQNAAGVLDGGWIPVTPGEVWEFKFKASSWKGTTGWTQFVGRTIDGSAYANPGQRTMITSASQDVSVIATIPDNCAWIIPEVAVAPGGISYIKRNTMALRQLTDANLLVEGTVTAKHIAANSITVDKLKVSGSNAIPDPMFLDSELNTARINGSTIPNANMSFVADDESTAKVMKFTEHSDEARTFRVSDEHIKVTQGDRIKLSFKYRTRGNVTSGTSAVRWAMYHDTATKAYIRYVGLGSYQTINTSGANWYTHEYDYVVTQADTKYIRPVIQMKNFGYSGDMEIKEPRVEVSSKLSVVAPVDTGGTTLEAQLGIPMGSSMPGLSFVQSGPAGPPTGYEPATVTSESGTSLKLYSGKPGGSVQGLQPSTVILQNRGVDIDAGLNTGVLNITAGGGVKVNGYNATRTAEFTVNSSKEHFNTANQDIGLPTYVAASSTDRDLAGVSTGRLTLNASGIYGIDFHLVLPAVAKGRTFIQIGDANGNALNRVTIAVGEDQTSASISGKYFADGAVLRFGLLHSQGATSTYRATVRVTKFV